MSDLIDFLFLRTDNVMFVCENITKRVLLRCSTLFEDYVIESYRGLFTRWGSTLHSRNGVCGFLSSNKNFFSYAEWAIYCSNHIHEFKYDYD